MLSGVGNQFSRNIYLINGYCMAINSFAYLTSSSHWLKHLRDNLPKLAHVRIADCVRNYK